MVSPCGAAGKADTPFSSSSSELCGGHADRPAKPPVQSQPAPHSPRVVVVRRTEPLVQEPLLGADRAPEDEQHRGREQHEPPERGRQQRQPEVEQEQADVQRVPGEPVWPLLDQRVRRPAQAAARCRAGGTATATSRSTRRTTASAPSRAEPATRRGRPGHPRAVWPASRRAGAHRSRLAARAGTRRFPRNRAPCPHSRGPHNRGEHPAKPPTSSAAIRVRLAKAMPWLSHPLSGVELTGCAYRAKSGSGYQRNLWGHSVFEGGSRLWPHIPAGVGTRQDRPGVGDGA